MEAIHKISDAPLKQCPECKQETLRKLMSAAAFKLTGTGWYETDFKDKKPQNNEKKDSKVADNKGSEKSGKPETTESKTKTSDTGKSSEKSGSKASSTKK